MCSDITYLIYNVVIVFEISPYIACINDLNDHIPVWEINNSHIRDVSSVDVMVMAVNTWQPGDRPGIHYNNNNWSVTGMHHRERTYTTVLDIGGSGGQPRHLLAWALGLRRAGHSTAKPYPPWAISEEEGDEVQEVEPLLPQQRKGHRGPQFTAATMAEAIVNELAQELGDAEDPDDQVRVLLMITSCLIGFLRVSTIRLFKSCRLGQPFMEQTCHIMCQNRVSTGPMLLHAASGRYWPGSGTSSAIPHIECATDNVPLYLLSHTSVTSYPGVTLVTSSVTSSSVLLKTIHQIVF